MQVFIHDVTVNGALRDTDAALQARAAGAAQGIASVPGLTFTGVRVFIERQGGQDRGLLVIEGAKFGGKEFPTAAEMDQLETDLRNGILSDPGVVSVGVIRFHGLTAPAV